jgi:hypothetical protein
VEMNKAGLDEMKYLYMGKSTSLTSEKGADG